MSLDTSINALTTATNSLLSAVNDSKADLTRVVAAASIGWKYYLTIALRDAAAAPAAGTSPLCFVYYNNNSATDAANGVYQWVGSSWQRSDWFFDGLEMIVQPLVDQAQAAASAATSSGITSLGATANGNAITVTGVPNNSFVPGNLYRFVSPITNTGAITINDRPVFNPDGSPASAAGLISQNGDVIFRFQFEGVVFRLVSSSSQQPINNLAYRVGQIEPAITKASTDLTITRDPWAQLWDKLGPFTFGTTNYTAGVPTTTKTFITIATFGNSHGVGQGTSAANIPGAQLKKVIESLIPEVVVYHDNYAVPGSWAAQLNGQIDGMVTANTTALASGGDGRSRMPDIALIMDSANDGITNIYHAYEGPNGYEGALADVYTRLQNLGAVTLSLTAPLPHPTRSFANGRFDFEQSIFCVWPKACFLSGDDFQTFTYNASAKTITSSVQGQFFASNGMLTVNSWLIDETNTYHQVASIDATGTTVTLKTASIPANRVSTKAIRQCRINDETQLVPKRSESLALRDLNGNGVMITTSVRHLTLNRICRYVTASKGAILVDWAAAQQALLTSDAMYDTLYPNNDDFHMGDQGYLLLTPLFRKIIARVVSGAGGA